MNKLKNLSKGDLIIKGGIATGVSDSKVMASALMRIADSLEKIEKKLSAKK
jgi:hypothetical protein